MQSAYRKIDFLKPVMTLNENVDHISIRGKADIAAVSYEKIDAFLICDLRTRTVRTLPKKSVCGNIYLSSNGSQVLTVNIAQKEPQIVDLDIWDCKTLENTHTIQHPHLIDLCRLINQDDNTNKLIFVDTIGNLYIYEIKPNSILSLSEHITLDMKVRGSVFNYSAGEYRLYGSTIYKNSPAFYLCSQAIKNTQNKDSLPNIKTAMLYLSLPSFEKESIDKEIEERKTTLIKQEQQQKTFLSWFG